MTTNKLAIIGGSGLYDVEEFKDRELLDLNTPWGKQSDQNLKTKYNAVKNDKLNRARMVEIGSYEYDRYEEHKQIFQKYAY